MRAIRIDRTKSLAQEPRCGHNRYHPDIEPVLEVDEGEEIALETRDAIDGQITPSSTVADMGNVNYGLFSTGDGHFTQGDGEVCVTAVEMGATAVVRFRVHKGRAASRKFMSPVFTQSHYFAEPKFAVPERFLGVMGMPITQGGEIEAENLTLACRNAVLNMMELLQERGFSREQSYVICSVAVDLRVSNVVDVPNYVVSALLPEAIFDGD